MIQKLYNLGIKKIILILFFVSLNNKLFSQKEVPFTFEDRERLVRIETSLKEFKEYTDKRFEQIDKRFEQLIHIFIGIVAAFAGIVAVTIGFAIWDRRKSTYVLFKEK